MEDAHAVHDRCLVAKDESIEAASAHVNNVVDQDGISVARLAEKRSSGYRVPE